MVRKGFSDSLGYIHKEKSYCKMMTVYTVQPRSLKGLNNIKRHDISHKTRTLCTNKTHRFVRV